MSRLEAVYCRLLNLQKSDDVISVFTASLTCVAVNLGTEMIGTWAGHFAGVAPLILG